MRTTSPFLTCARLRTSGPATMVTVLPSAPFRVTCRVFWLILCTVAVPVTVSSPLLRATGAGDGFTAARGGGAGSGGGVDFLAAQPASAPAQSTIPIVLSVIIRPPVLAARRRSTRSRLRAKRAQSELADAGSIVLP